MLKRGRSRGALVAACLVVVLVAGALSAVTSASAVPQPAQSDPVQYPTRDGAKEPVSVDPTPQPRPTAPVPDVQSVSGDATVDAKGGTVDVAGAPLSLKVDAGALPDGTQVHVEVLDSAVGAQVSQSGFAFRVAFRDKASKVVQPTGKVLLHIDYSAIAHRFGADYAGRLRVVTVPDCQFDAETKKSSPAASGASCPAERPLITQDNDIDKSTLTVDLGPGGLKPLAVATISGDQQGDAVPVTTDAPATGTDSGADSGVTPPPASTSSSTSTSSTTSTVPAGDGAATAKVKAGTLSADSTASSTSTSTAVAPSTTSSTAPPSTTTSTAPASATPVAPRAGLSVASGAGGGTFALTSGAAGPSGDYGATPQTGVGTSEVGMQSGSAESEYPIELPPASSGATPQVKLQYSSASIDGFTTDHNTQASDVGIGWQLNVGSITRQFKACNSTDAPGDLCWAGFNYQITLNGVTDDLVPSGIPGQWRLSHDPFWKVEELTRAADSTYGTLDNSYRYPDNTNAFLWFQVTTPDGVKYRFGGQFEPGTNTDQFSAWSVPVYNPGTLDPCHNKAYWMCNETYRWNLDRVEDTSGNVTSYFYAAASNYYNARSGQAGSWKNYGYVPGGYLARIEYTKRAGFEIYPDAHQRVIFTEKDRCTGNPCTIFDYPDSPMDLLCWAPTMTTCDQGSPSFWLAQRLDSITTQINDGDWRAVRQYQLSQSYPDPDPLRPGTVTASSRKMQLDSIQRVGTNQPQPTRFSYVYPYNRVNYPTGVSPMATARLQSVTNEIGGKSIFWYSRPEPCAQNTVYNYTDFHLDCFPAFYGVGPLPGWIPFNKWIVVQETDQDQAGGMPDQNTTYAYPGGPSWHYNVNPVLPDVGTTNPQQAERNWNEFRGFHHVIATDVASGNATGYRFFQGMNGDRLTLTTTKSVSITLSDGTTQSDNNWLAGMEADQVKANGSNPQVWRRRTDYYSAATNGAPLNSNWNANPSPSCFVAPSSVTETTQGAPAKESRVRYTYNSYGHVQYEIHDGDTSVAGDDWYIDRAYAPVDTSRWIHGLLTTEIRRNGSNTSAGTNFSKVQYTYVGGTNPTKPLPLTESRWTDGGVSNVVTTATDYFPNGLLKSSTDPNGNQTQYSYDPVWGAAGFTTVTDALGRPVTTVGDKETGLPTQVTDANGNVTNETYDKFGRVTAVQKPTSTVSNPTMKFTYFMWAPGIGPAAVQTSQRAGSNNIDSYTWVDGFGRTIQTSTKSPTQVSGNAAKTSTGYDASGNAYRTSAPQEVTGAYNNYVAPAWNSVTSYHLLTYDQLGRVTRDSLKGSGGVTVSNNDTSYDGWTRTTVPPVGGNTVYKTDGNGNLSQVTEYNVVNGVTVTYQTNYGYDLSGRLTDITDASNNHTSNTYDWLGRKTASTDPDAGPWNYVYDGDGNLTQQTDARSKAVFFKYDHLNRITEKRQDNPTTGALLASYTYDAPGYLGLADTSTSYDLSGNAYADRVMQYDALNRPKIRQWTIPAAATGVDGQYRMQYTYDQADHLTSIQYPADKSQGYGETVNTTYDSLGYPDTLTGTSTTGVTTTYVSASDYTTNGSLASQTLGASAITRSLTYEPDTLRLSTMKAGSGGSTTNLQKLTYGYDDVNNVTSIADGNNANQKQCFEYDKRNRLDWAYTGNDACSAQDTTRGTNPAPYSQSFHYDATGNFISNSMGRSYSYGTKPHAPITVGSDSFSYDANGSEQGRTVNGVGALFSYDSLNHLTAVGQSSGSTSSYIYGADDQRLIRKDGNTITLYLDDGNYQVRSVNGAGATSTTYYLLGGQRVAWRTGPLGGTPGSVKYELSDQLGSASVTTDASGTNPARQNYYPFGDLRPGPGNNLPIDETYLGKTLDSTTALVQMGVRYYDPAVGRFTSVDPIGAQDTPESLNPYSYAVNDPVTLSDPTGKFACDDPRNCGNRRPLGGNSPDPDWPIADSPSVTKTIAIGEKLGITWKPKTHKDLHRYKEMVNGLLWQQACGSTDLLICYSVGKLQKAQNSDIAQTLHAAAEIVIAASGYHDVQKCAGSGDAGSCATAAMAVASVAAGEGDVGAAGEAVGAASEGGAGAIVIGEDMEGRVIPTAQSLGAEYYDPPDAPPGEWMENDRRWINDRMDAGCTVYDCGAAPGRANFPDPTSPYYEMELQEIAKREYQTTPVKGPR